MKTSNIIVLLFLPYFVLMGQVNTYSPYSYFGIGTIYNNSSVTSMSMGGLGISLNNPHIINFNNPTSYSFLNQTAFEIGGSSTILTLSQNNLEQKNHISGLLNLGLAFPLSQKIGVAIGLFPYSSVGYSINSEINNNDLIGNVNYNYSGSGGLNKLVFGIGSQIISDFSFGLNINYFFGPINKFSDLESQNSIIQFQEQESFSIQGLNADLGLSYRYELDNMVINIASTIAPESQLNIKKNIFQYTYITSGEYQSFMDTILYVDNETGDLVMPISYGFGASLLSKDNWLLGIDYTYTNWSNYSMLGQSYGYMYDKSQIIIGGSFTPQKTDIYNYWNRIEYRMGVAYSRGYLDLASLSNLDPGTPLEDLSISFGAALPMNKVVSKANIGLRYGIRGAIQSGNTTDYINEKYFSISLSMTLNEKWFKKRKIE